VTGALGSMLLSRRHERVGETTEVVRRDTPVTVKNGQPEGHRNIAVCSMEAWDDIWRRNQFLVQELLRADPVLRVLFVEPAVDVPYEVAQRRWPGRAGLRKVTTDGRLWALHPRKFLPRLLAPGLAERHLAHAVRAAMSELRLSQPLLWVNDTSYATLADQVDWPVVYDVTDDWLLAGGEGRALARLRQEDARLVNRADEIVVVSASLLASRGATRPVHIIGCAVDVQHLRTPRPRPADLPLGPTAVYVGTQHDERLDVQLCIDTARAIAPARLVFVGPNCLKPESVRRLLHSGCALLGPRPYTGIPGYYQHADMVVVPHSVNAFTESLDPIKGYECVAVGRPTLTTPVAGMRDLGPPVEVSAAAEFPARARQILAGEHPSRPGQPPTWADRADAFAAVLEGARRKRAGAI